MRWQGVATAAVLGIVCYTYLSSLLSNTSLVSILPDNDKEWESQEDEEGGEAMESMAAFRGFRERTDTLAEQQALRDVADSHPTCSMHGIPVAAVVVVARSLSTARTQVATSCSTASGSGSTPPPRVAPHPFTLSCASLTLFILLCMPPSHCSYY